MLMIEH